MANPLAFRMLHTTTHLRTIYWCSPSTRSLLLGTTCSAHIRMRTCLTTCLRKSVHALLAVPHLPTPAVKKNSITFLVQAGISSFTSSIVSTDFSLNTGDAFHWTYIVGPPVHLYGPVMIRTCFVSSGAHGTALVWITGCPFTCGPGGILASFSSLSSSLSLLTQTGFGGFVPSLIGHGRLGTSVILVSSFGSVWTKT